MFGVGVPELLVLVIIIGIPLMIYVAIKKGWSKRSEKVDGDIPKKLLGVIHGFQFFGILGIVLSFGLALLFLMFLTIWKGQLELDQNMAVQLVSSMVSVMIGGLIFSPLLLFAAKGLKSKKKWAKYTAIVISIFCIPGFPIGTIAGISWLIRLYSKDTAQWFATAMVSNP